MPTRVRTAATVPQPTRLGAEGYDPGAMSSPRRIGILTGGGDVPGLNSVIKSVVYRATEIGDEVVGIRRGWEGLTHLRFDPAPDPHYIVALDRTNTRTIDRTGGTWLHTSRTNPKKMTASTVPAWLEPARVTEMTGPDGVVDLTPIVLDNIERLGLDVLVTIGGDDTLSFSRVLCDQGVPLVAIPKTMDNDVAGTEYCIGFSTAITRAKELINRQRTTLGSHERIGVFRIFGRDAGFSALYTSYVTSARCVIPEAPYDIDRLAAVLSADRDANPSRYAVVVTAEGAIWNGARMQDVGEADMFGHRHKANVGEALAAELKLRTGIETVASELTYDLRSGEPDALDAMVATTFANVAMDLIRDGVTGRMMAIRDGKYAHTELPAAGTKARRVDLADMYNEERFRPRYEGKLGDPMLLVGVGGGVAARV
jgi:ATP-dependent phosphofructokinase / diphosphate-dependent phosphofructokinase